MLKKRLRNRVLPAKTHGFRLLLIAVLVAGFVYEFPETEIAADSTPRNGAAGSVTAEHFVPVVLSSPGQAGSFYTTELTFTNRGNTTVNVDLGYTASTGSGTGTVSVTIPPGQVVISDAIDYLKTLGLSIPDGGSQVGTLRAGFSNLNSANEVNIMARTTTVVKDGEGSVAGRAGLAYPALSLSSSNSAAINQVNHSPGNPPGNKGLANSASQVSTGFNDEFAYICGLRANASDRSNVAFQNLGTAGDGNITLQATLCPGDGTEFCSQWSEFGLTPGAFVQYSVGNPTSNLSNNLYMVVERKSGTAPFYAYGVINDNANSDGSFVSPFPVLRFPPGPTPVAGLTLPVIVQTGTFSSELILSSHGDNYPIINFTFVSDAVTTADHTAHFSIDTSKMTGYQLIIGDIFGYMRGHADAGIPPAGTHIAGALFATSSSGDISGIALAARTTGAGGSVGGRFGLFYESVPYGQASTTDAWLYGLQQNSENRTNLAIVNTGETDASNDTFVIDLYDGATGNLVKTMDPINLTAQGWMQIGSILTNASGVTQGYAHVRRTAGNNPFITYAVINDGAGPGQRTGDGAYIASSQ